mgnify:CR=1 FL=1
MNPGRKWIAAVFITLALLAAACSSQVTPAPVEPPLAEEPPATEEPVGELVIKPAPVDGVELLLLESFPLQMNAIVRGNLPDGCSEISHSDQTTDGNVIRIDLYTRRPADAICTLALVAYEETIPVDILGLPAGEYVVSVNGVEASFTLDVDNVATE